MAASDLSRIGSRELCEDAGAQHRALVFFFFFLFSFFNFFCSDECCLGVDSSSVAYEGEPATANCG